MRELCQQEKARRGSIKTSLQLSGMASPMSSPLPPPPPLGDNYDSRMLQRAIELAIANVQEGKGGPFGAVIVCDGHVVAEACNAVTSTTDPTAHAEMQAIRAACRQLGRFELSGCTLYTSCEPCPMCLGAIYWSHIDRVYFANTRPDAASIGFDEERIDTESTKPMEERRIPSSRMSVGSMGKDFEVWECAW